MLKTLIVDDEPLARDELRSQLARFDDVDIVGECSNAIEAIGAIQRQKPDVVFLDIQMPRISGLEMLSMLDQEHMPYIVFLTAYDEYAVSAFDENAFDYLLKPTDFDRLTKTIARLRQEHTQQALPPIDRVTPLRHVPCSGANRIMLIRLEDIEFATSRLSGVYVTRTDGEEHFTELTLRTLEERTALMRCHRQYLINLEAISEIRFVDNGLAEIVTLGGRKVPVSRHYLREIKDRLSLP
jgi:two-component system, LytTR family, response regulator